MRSWLLSLCFCCVVWGARAQSFEAQQLLLDVQKLAQEKQLLADLQKGYDILAKGYGAIRDLSKGSFDLHQAFLDGLLLVSPAVKKYKRVADIISMQAKMGSAYRSAWERVRHDTHFTLQELSVIGAIYSESFSQSVACLNSLSQVLTDGQLRADDGERIRRIDGLYDEMQRNQLSQASLTNRVEWLSVQRSAEAGDLNRLKQYYGIK